ncbi:MAG: MBL fold metallo-hydrolase [Firmicutes bacterium]|nr:MBL fold metallo-hydrolase [Bacillota bacterium]
MDNNKLDSLRILVLAENTAMHGTRFLAQHGMSYLLQAQTKLTTRTILVDVGQNHYALIHNMGMFGINPQDIDMIVITHSHYDHTKGLSSLLREIGKEEIPVVGHPDNFKLNLKVDPYLHHIGMALDDQPQNITANGGRLFLTKEPLQLMPGLTTTGEVPRLTDFEDPGIKLYTINNGRIEKDTIMDDISIVANIKAHGIVVITGCGHAGIVNIVRHAVSIFPEQPLNGIIGGFHLIDANDMRIQQTIKELLTFNPRFLSAGHCTGFKAQAAFAKGFKDKFIQLTCGLEFIISSTANGEFRNPVIF